jgi:hypothetical protein
MYTKANKKSVSKKTVKHKIDFITDSNGEKKAAIVPIDKYNEMLEELEDVRDIKIADGILKNNPKFIKFNNRDYV